MAYESRVSRKEFLKILGSGSLVLFGTMIGLGTATSMMKSGRKELIPSASAESSDGSWSLGPNTLSVAIHAALLKSGKILYVAGSGDNPANAAGPFKAALLDPKTQDQTEIILSEDLFCCGHCQLEDGNVLFAGGTKAYKGNTLEGLFQGLACAYIFDADKESFTKVTSMAHGRWYPTLVTLRNANVFANSGLDEFGCMNDLTEIYAKNDSWTIKYDPSSDMTYCVGHCSSDPGAGSPCYGGPGSGTNPPIFMYPRMHLLPNGWVAVCGQLKTLWTWNPTTGKWREYGSMIFGARSYGSTALLPLRNTQYEKGSILIMGGSPDSSSPATNHCEIAFWNDTGLHTRATSPMNYSRRYPTPVILPDGKVLVIGGTALGNDKANAVYTAEIFDPVTEQWAILPSATVPRMYHSVGLLLPDGRVWTASTSYSTKKAELRTEIFSPSYASGDRPSISGPPEVGQYGEKIKIPTKDGLNIKTVSLIRLSTITHNLNTDQRLVWLRITNKTKFNVVVAAPLNSSLAPPGYYLLHLIDNDGIPSEGAFVKIG